MRNRKELEKLLGTETIPKLNEFIDEGKITRNHLREMAGEMGVIVTFNGFDKDPFTPAFALSAMLDKETLKLLCQCHIFDYT